MDAAPPDSRGQPGDRGERERSWRAASGLVGVLAALLVVLWLLSLTSGSGNSSDAGGRDADPVGGDRSEAPAATGPVPAPAVGTGAQGTDQGAASAGGADQGAASAGGADQAAALAGGAETQAAALAGGADQGAASAGGADQGAAVARGADQGAASAGGADQGAALAGGAETPAAALAGGADQGAAAGRFSDLDGRLTYLSGSHVAMVDLATGALERLPLEPFGSVLLDGLALLTDGRRTVGVSLAGDRPTAVLIASGAELVPSAEPLVQYWVISRPDGPDGAVRLNAWQRYGVLTGELVAPPGSEVLAARGAGVLVVPPVGRTFRPRLDGFEVASEHRLLAASDKVRVEQRCDDDLSCTVLATDAATGRAADLPDDFVAELAGVSISPDGRWLLNDTSPAWLFDRQTGRLRLLDGGGYGRPQWSDDSGSVAWLTSDRTPTLVVARLEPSDDGQDWFAVELAGLGADPSPGSSFLLDPPPPP